MLNEVDEEDSVGIQIAENIALVEYYYNIEITPHYPLMKRLNMQEHIQKFIKLDGDNMAGAVSKAIAGSFK